MVTSSADSFNGLTKIVKKGYSNPDRIKNYMKVGLWPSEENLIDRFFPTGSTVLDVGCGAGRVSIALAKKGYVVTGIDFLPEMIEVANHQAKSHGINVDFRVMDATNLDFSRESFQNVLFLFNLLEFVPGKRNREIALKKAWEVLEPGSYLILTIRSGLAIGKRTIAWLLVLFEYMLYRVIMRKNWEFGDKVWKSEYYHYINPFRLRKIVWAIGFETMYFNSSKNLDKGKEATFFTNFSSDIALFFVLKKAAKRLP